MPSTYTWTLDDAGSHFDAPLIKVFIGLQLAGGLGLAIVVLTAFFSRRVTRNSTWYAFLVSWILSCASYTFIFIIGEQSKPTYGPCLVQAAGIYSAPALTSCATFAFGLDMLIGVRAAAKQDTSQRRHWITLALVIVPYFIWLALFLAILMFGVINPHLVKMGPNGTYCDFNSDTPSKVSSLIAISSTLFLLVIEGYIVVQLIKQRQRLQAKQLTTMATRVLIFSLLGALGLGVGVAYVLYSLPGMSSDIVMATLPVGGVLIFGTQMDLVNVWLFWRDTPAAPVEIEDTKSIIPDLPTPRFEP